MIYENAKIEVILADEDISMDIVESEVGDPDTGLDWEQWGN